MIPLHTSSATNTVSDVSNAGTIPQETDLNNVQGTVTNGYNARLTADDPTYQQKIKILAVEHQHGVQV